MISNIFYSREVSQDDKHNIATKTNSPITSQSQHNKYKFTNTLSKIRTHPIHEPLLWLELRICIQLCNDTLISCNINSFLTCMIEKKWVQMESHQNVQCKGLVGSRCNMKQCISRVWVASD